MTTPAATAGTDTDVLVVGAGPVGLSLALCLARSGVRSVVLERRTEGNPHPRAHLVNTRTMELFRLWGVDHAVRAAAYPAEHLPFDMLVPLGGISARERERLSPATVTSCAQDRVEAALRSALAAQPDSTLRWGHALLGLQDEGDHVTATVGGPGGEQRLTARWLVGADGAASTVRGLLGVDLVGDRALASMVNIAVEGRLHPPGVVPPLAMPAPDPDVPGAFVSMDGDRRWCFHYSGDDLEDVAELDDAGAAALVRRAAGVAEDHPLDVLSTRRWTMSAVVADRMRVGSVFLVGDAAHAFPPTGGFGMNSGIQDAHNLAWKLAAVLGGTGGETLLDSYEQERLPVAYLNTAQSLRNAHRHSTGEDAAPSAALVEARATPSVRSQAQVATTVDERDRLEVLEHSVAIGQDLGFAYDTSPVVTPDGAGAPEVWIARYTPSASPGARAPHVWLRRPDGTLVSTVDLFDGSFTLVTSTRGLVWERAVGELEAGLRPRVLAVGPGGDLEPVGDVDVATLYGVSPTGAVLVRPDGHVAFRAEHAPSDPATVLARAVRTALGAQTRRSRPVVGAAAASTAAPSRRPA